MNEFSLFYIIYDVKKTGVSEHFLEQHLKTEPFNQSASLLS